MATALFVEGKKPGDFVLSEAPSHYSRAVKTVLSGQNIRIGQVCMADTAGKIKTIAGTGNEVHTFNVAGTITGGSFRLRLWHKDGYWVETGDIAHDGTFATVVSNANTALDAMFGASAIVASGSAYTGLILTFSGTGYASKSQPFGTLIWSALTGATGVSVTRTTSSGAAVNEVQTLTLSAAIAASDTLQVTLYSPDGEPIVCEAVPYNTSVAQTVTDLNTAITAAATLWYGSASVGAVAASSDGITWTLTYSGNGFAGKAVPLALAVFVDNSAGGSAKLVRTTAGGKKGASVTTKAVAVALEDVDASAADKTGLFLVRDAKVIQDQLYYDGADIAACAESLLAVGIIVEAEGSVFSVGI